MLTRFRIHLAYAIGGVANSLALFLLIPYLVLRLSVADYGTWVLFEVLTLLITMVASAGIDVGLIRSYRGENADPPRALVGTVIIGSTIWGAVLFLIGAGLYFLITTVPLLQTILPPTFAPNALLLVMVIGVTEGWFNLLIAILRVREQAISYALVTFGRMILFAIFVVIGIEGGGGLMGALTGRLLAAILGVAGVLILILPHFDWEWHRSMWTRVMRYGLPLLPSNLAAYLLFAADRYILTAFTSTQVVGIYSFMYKLATSLDIIIIRPFSLDWAQRRFTVATRPDAAHAYGRIALLFLWVALALALLLFSATRAIYTWLADPIYEEAIPYIPIILLALIAYGLSYPLNIGMILKDRTDWLPPLSWMSAIVCVGLNLWWIPLFGIAGAAWATLISYSVYTIGYAIASQRLYPIHYPWADVLKLLVSTLVAGAGIYAIDFLMPTAIVVGTILKVIWISGWMGGIGYLLFGHYLPLNRLAYRLEKSKG